MLEGELPELFVLVWVVLGMGAGVLVSSGVAEPDVVALVGEEEPWCLVLIIDQPGVG